MGTKIPLFFTILLVTAVQGIKVYRSTLDFLEEKLSGLHFLNSQNHSDFAQSFGLCLRFNFKRLGKSSDITKPRIIYIPSPYSKRNFLTLTAEYEGAWFHFGNYERPNAYSNWVLFEPPDNFKIWSANKWHHLCIAFEKSTSFVKLVKVLFSKLIWTIFAKVTFKREKVNAVANSLSLYQENIAFTLYYELWPRHS